MLKNLQCNISNTFTGPEIRVSLGDYVNITVINQLEDELTTLHWHGMTQEGTSYCDGPPGYNQCLIGDNDIEDEMDHDIVDYTRLSYLFKPQSSGTFWYHGHYDEQTVDGAYGAFIVEDSVGIKNAYIQNGVRYDAETTLLLSDFYNQEAAGMIPWYLSPASGGNEPMPEAIIVNNLLHNKLIVNINKKDKLRVRIINAAPFSMFDVSVDGMPLTVIEMDGVPTKPFSLSYVPVNAAQRVSFILDWSRLPTSMKNSPSVIIRVKAYSTMYPIYDPTLPNNGLFATASRRAYNVEWNGRFLFNELKTTNNGNPNYNTVIPPESSAKPPSDSNLLQAKPLFNDPVPAPDLNMNYLIEFYEDNYNVNRPHINGFSNPGPSTEELSNPVLYQYMSNGGGPLKEKVLPVGAWIEGDGITPFVLPFNRTVDVFLNNTDGGGHPVHLHGHSFWIMKTSQYDSGHAVRRDIVTVPPQGWAIIRFVSNNPGVWLMHCHIDWHLRAGFAATIIEAPSKLKGTIGSVPYEHKSKCAPFVSTLTSKKSSSAKQACIQQCTDS